MPQGPEIDTYIYSRVSTKKQLSGMGIALQDKNLKACLAEHPQWTLKGSFRDLGISAYKGANRLTGEFGEFLKLVDKKKVRPGSVLLVYSLDRVTRDNIIDAQGLLLDLLRAEIVICTTIDRMVFSRHDDQQAVLMKLIMSLLIMLRANEESTTKSNRGKDNWEAKRVGARNHGIGLSKNVPAWLDTDDNRKAIENLEKSRIMVRMFELCAMGHGYAGILQRLNAEGLKSFGRSGEWSTAYIRQILTDRAAIGEKQLYLCNYDTDKIPVPVGDPIKGYYPAVIPWKLWESAQHQLAKRSAASPGLKTRGDMVGNLFGRLCRCVECKGSMETVGHSKNKALHYLRCHNRYVRKTCATGGNYAYEQFESTVLGALRRILADDLTSDDDATSKIEAEITRLTNDLRSAEKAHGRLYDLYADGDDDPILSQKISDGRVRISTLKAQINDAERSRTISSMRPESLASDVSAALVKRALDNDPDARAEVASEIRSIVSLVGFGPDSLIIVEVANGERFIGIRKGVVLWTLRVDTATGEADYPVVLDQAWTDDAVYAAVTTLAGLAPAAKPDIAKAVARIKREQDRIIQNI